MPPNPAFPQQRLVASVATVSAIAGDSLSGINTRSLASGALCFVLENAALYRLDKDSAATADGSSVVAPAAGPGRWFQLAGGAGAAAAGGAFQGWENAIGQQTWNFTAPTTWINDPGTFGPNYSLLNTGANQLPFTFDAARGRLTYAGAVAATFRIDANVGWVHNGGANFNLGMAIDVNDTLVTTQPGAVSFQMDVSLDAVAQGVQPMSVWRVLTLSPNDVVNLAAINGNNTDDALFDQAQFLITPV